jgi:exopolysaccharide biosynthesis polyprenyl glycosylphosphotransferase
MILKNRHIRKRVLIVGGGQRAQAIAEVLQQTPPKNYDIVGFVDDNFKSTGNKLEDRLLLGKTVDLPRLVIQNQIQDVVVALDHYLEEKLFHLLVECQERGIRVSYMPDLHEKLRYSVPIEHIDPTWALGIIQKLPNPIQLFAKRIVDILFGIVGLLNLVTILPFVALAIYLDSPGPIFYRQVRIGLAGKPFSIIKFRTMSIDAEKDGKACWASDGDIRITRVGHFLRQTGMDELPQVLNVLRGEMSIVGPRPERPQFIEHLERDIPFYRTRLMVKPGLTGWAQVRYKYGNSMKDALIKLQYDCYYLRHWSLWLDLYIILRTIKLLLKLRVHDSLPLSSKR